LQTDPPRTTQGAIPKARFRTHNLDTQMVPLELLNNPVNVLFRDVNEMTRVVNESQKIFDVNPWDFEPDCYPADGKLVHIRSHFRLSWLTSLSYL